MKKIHENEIHPSIILGKRGSVNAFDVITGTMTAGVRVIQRNSDVPTRPHIHSEKQLLYLIEGVADITNGKETLSLKPGDFVLLESNEEHYVITQDQEAKVFEIKYS
ncbi:MAG: cupin domain-containing protein [Candidatus Thorarchaeota archaeon]|nr:cupin domain-containing protein [Candidatus Thorarchaeota archaeon]